VTAYMANVADICFGCASLVRAMDSNGIPLLTQRRRVSRQECRFSCESPSGPRIMLASALSPARNPLKHQRSMHILVFTPVGSALTPSFRVRTTKSISRAQVYTGSRGAADKHSNPPEVGRMLLPRALKVVCYPARNILRRTHVLLQHATAVRSSCCGERLRLPSPVLSTRAAWF
jgi:hypothetical protein